MFKVSDSVVQAVKSLVELGLPPSRIVPPVDFLYADDARITMLFSEVEPAFAEMERTVTSESKMDGSFGLERKPLSLTADRSKGRTETHGFKRVDASTQRQCIDVINKLLARETPPYYKTFDQQSAFEILKQAKDMLNSAHDGLASPSLFTMKSVDSARVSVLEQLVEDRKKAPTRAIETAIRTQLRQLSGLVIVEGDFRRVSHTTHDDAFEEQFKGDPGAIFFRFVLHDKAALRLIPNQAKLWVLGNVIGKWDGGRYLDFYPIAIF